MHSSGMPKKNGFSLLELLIVIGVLAFIGTFSLVASMDLFRSHLFDGDRDGIVTALQKVRSRAISNICLGSACTDGKSHGVHFDFSSGKYTLFQDQGTGYNSSDLLNEEHEINKTMTISGSADIIFSQLSGDVLPEGSITITDDAGNSSVITINDQGQILWTN